MVARQEPQGDWAALRMTDEMDFVATCFLRYEIHEGWHIDVCHVVVATEEGRDHLVEANLDLECLLQCLEWIFELETMAYKSERLWELFVTDGF